MLCDMKHCSTYSKHQHLCAKRIILWLSKYDKMRFPTGTPPRLPLGSSQRSPDPTVSWAGDIPPQLTMTPGKRRETPLNTPHILSTRRLGRLDFPASGARHSAPRRLGLRGHCPQIFSTRTAPGISVPPEQRSRSYT